MTRRRRGRTSDLAPISRILTATILDLISCDYGKLSDVIADNDDIWWPSIQSEGVFDSKYLAA